MHRLLIEVALPLEEMSEQSVREKSIWHRHVCALHIWWTGRALAACRAVVFNEKDGKICDIPARHDLEGSVLDHVGSGGSIWGSGDEMGGGFVGPP